LLLLAVAGALGTALPASAATPQPDAAYLDPAHQLNLTIIQAAHTATVKGKTQCVRRVGAQLERDHRRLAAQELEVAGRLGINLAVAPSPTQRQQLTTLGAKAGKNGYDAAWVLFQRQKHQEYLTLVTGPTPKAASPAVEAVANGAKPVVEMDLRTVAGQCKTATGTPSVDTGTGGMVADAEQTRSRAALGLIVLGLLLLLVGKSVSVRRRLFGIGALAAGLVMLFGGVTRDAGQVPKASAAVQDREAAVPPVDVKLPGMLDAQVEAVATGGDGKLQVPTKADVGWWAAGAAPGAEGGTVLLAGHVDTAQGRGVFAKLSEVPMGARVAVTGGDGEEHWYKIVARRTYQQGNLPPDLFNGAAKPRLALVTCTGSYDHAAHRYSQNLVLYGVPLD
jgi:predicted outer membrane protein